MNIQITWIRLVPGNSTLKATVSLLIENQLAIHDIKVIDTGEKLFVAMPSRPDNGGKFRDVVHPISAELRAIINDEILSAYYAELTK
ncbi:MAG: SpoVG family protein [Oscillospiraceae bacterium]